MNLILTRIPGIENSRYALYPACGAMLLTYLEFHDYALLMQKMFYFCLIILLGWKLNDEVYMSAIRLFFKQTE